MRSAARVRLIRNLNAAAAPACTGLICYLPSLETVDLRLIAPLATNDLGGLLEALAWCTRLRALGLNMRDIDSDGADDDLYLPFPAPALAHLSSLTWLALQFDEQDPYALADLVGALVSLTGLAELRVGFPKPAVVPAVLGQLTGLRVLELYDICPCALEAGCFDLPDLEGLVFVECTFQDAEVLLGVSALQHLAHIEILCCDALYGVDAQLAQLPGLQRLVLSRESQFQDLTSFSSPPAPLRLPADMGSLSSTLLHLDVSGLRLAHFPPVLTQLVALEHLNATGNKFAELPACVTALSKLTELVLGRLISSRDPLQLQVKRPLGVCALGDLSSFPALRKLTMTFCEAMLCASILGAAGHGRLASLCFCIAHPAPECAPAVLQLSRELWRLGRGSVVKAVSERRYVGNRHFDVILDARHDAQGRAPFQRFKADLEACRQEACGL